MLSKKVVESARFLKMPATSKLLYFYLVLNADDDGVVEAFRVLNLIKADEDDLRVLYAKGFVHVLNEDLITYIEDWLEQNKIRADRKQDSVYLELLLSVKPDVKLVSKKRRSDLVQKSGPSMDCEMSAQGKLSKGKLSKGNISECIVVDDTAIQIDELSTHTSTAYTLGKEKLSTDDYGLLIAKYPESLVQRVIQRIIAKPYYGCLNITKITEWCNEQMQNSSGTPGVKKESVHSRQLAKLAREEIG